MTRWGVTIVMVVVGIAASHFLAGFIMGCDELPRGIRAALSFITATTILVIRG